jgi:hypothetical protein
MSTPDRSNTLALTTSEISVVISGPCQRAATVATVSADPQQMATTTPRIIPSRCMEITLLRSRWK